MLQNWFALFKFCGFLFGKRFGIREKQKQKREINVADFNAKCIDKPLRRNIDKPLRR